MIRKRRIFNLITKKWENLAYEDDPNLVEVSKPSMEQLKACGLLKGYEPKSFSEMTPEEQKLFTNNEGKNNDEDT